MKDGGGIGVDQALEQRRIRDVAGERADPRVAGRWGRDDVEEHEAVDCLFPAVEAGELTALEQLLRQTPSRNPAPPVMRTFIDLLLRLNFALISCFRCAGDPDVTSAMISIPPICDRSASGTTTDPSAC